MTMSIPDLRAIVKQALKEDLGAGDITTRLLFPKAIQAKAVIQTKQEGVLAGLPVAKAVFKQVDPKLRFKPIVRDGDRVKPGMIVAHLHGDGRSILKGERVALNFLQHLSGVATLTAKFVEAVKGTNAIILDTRKTTPGLRRLEKYAVRMGGGRNHRFGLDNGILIKDNHLALIASVPMAVRLARTGARSRLKVEVEVTSLDQVKVALAVGATAVLLDNMSIAELREAVTLVNGRVFTEASGGITLANVRDVAATGVNAISIGALTHSAPSVDICLDIEKTVWGNTKKTRRKV